MTLLKQAAKDYAAASAMFLGAIVTYNLDVQPWILVIIVTIGAGIAVYTIPNAE